MKYQENKKTEDGFYLVLLAISLVTIITLLCFVLDTGKMYRDSLYLQKAADAATSVGIRALGNCTNNNQVCTKALEEKTINNIMNAVAHANLKLVGLDSQSNSLSYSFIQNDTNKLVEAEINPSGQKFFLAYSKKILGKEENLSFRSFANANLANVVLILDFSGSMCCPPNVSAQDCIELGKMQFGCTGLTINQTKADQLVEAVTSFLNHFNNSDNIEIILFNTAATSVNLTGLPGDKWGDRWQALMKQGLYSFSGDTNHSDALIEAFMIAANEAVATFLTKQEVPFPLRIHPEPSEEKLESLYAILRQSIFAHLVPARNTSKGIHTLLKAAQNTPQSSFVARLTLRSMMQAVYTPNTDSGHFGLASDCYCHFTSPIRRYADLMVHRALKNALNVPECSPIPAHQKLFALCDHCNEQERVAQNAEREIAKRLTCILLEKKVGKTFRGTVSGVISFGFFVEPFGFPADGLVRLETLHDDWYELDEKYQRIIGQRTKNIIALGDEVSVRLVSVNVERLEIDFKLEKIQSSFTIQRHLPHGERHARSPKNDSKSWRGQRPKREERPRDTKRHAKRRPRRTSHLDYGDEQ